MANKFYTVLVIDDKGSAVKELLFSRNLFRLAAAVAIMCVAVIIGGVMHYGYLYRSVAYKAHLLSQVEGQQADIENQRKQIQAFAQNINDLKTSLVSLNDFEQKVRVIANLEQKEDQASLFSIGGSMPEELDTNIGLKDDHGRLLRAMHEQLNQVNQATAAQRQSFESLLEGLKDRRSLLAATPSLRPASGWVSSEFGYRVSPFTGRRELHRGLDIANHIGTPIIAPADGVVTHAENQWLMGNMITIDHGYGMVTRYGHLDKILIKKGERIKRGQKIGLMGNTGRSTGPHLHYEVRLKGVPVNPRHYILD
jgi:murein DD-endopeptidase MepM/ murein hydrolase activator NlpD